MGRLFFILMFALTSLFSEDLVQIYRTQGVSALENKVEQILQDSQYWSKYLTNIDTKIGYYELDAPVVFVDKKAKKMKIYWYEKGKMSLAFSENVIVGKEGDKLKEGDLKTPVGVYDILRRFIPPDKFYGPVSYELSYPNVMDKLQSKNGYGIWIHGFPIDGAQRDVRTKGCVAVENDILLKFDEKLKRHNATVIISEVGDINVKKSTLSYLLADLFKWRDAWKKSDVEKYLGFYDKSFKRFDGKDKKAFAAMKRKIFNKNEKKIIKFSNISISPYPDLKLENLFRIAFYETYKTKNYKFDGKKELYVHMKENKMHILAEK